MSIKDRINQDLKSALLSHNQLETDTLRGLKSSILYVEVAQNSRETGLSDQEIITLLNKEAKKRQESAELYRKGGADDRASKELDEKKIIEKYLPPQIPDDEIKKIIDRIIEGLDIQDPRSMGIIISKVKEETKGAVDGAKVAQFTKERLSR